MSCEFHFDKLLFKIQNPAPSPTSIVTTLVHITTFSHLGYYQPPDCFSFLSSVWSFLNATARKIRLESKIMFLLC